MSESPRPGRRGNSGTVRVGIVGCGAIGSLLAARIERQFKKDYSLVGVSEVQPERYQQVARKLKRSLPCYTIAELAARVDLVIEAAGIDAADEVLRACLPQQRAAVIISVGVFVARPIWLRRIARQPARIYVPSGAVVGLDGLKAARMGTIKQVTLTTRKPVAGLLGAEYIRKKRISLTGLKKERLVFSGTAQQAIAGFPKNINVAAVLSLAGIGSRKTTVRIIADPALTKNTHTVEIIGDFGKIVTYAENVPAPDNPRTSALAILSVLAIIAEFPAGLRVGT